MTKVRGDVHTEDSVKGSENTKVPYMRGIFTGIDITSHLTLGTNWAIFRFTPQVFSSNDLYTRHMLQHRMIWISEFNREYI